MATKEEIQRWYPEALHQFTDVFPFAVDADFEMILCDKDSCASVHQEIVSKANAKPSKYLENTDGEMIVGPGGCFMLLYPWNIPNKKHFNRVFWHEMGHRCDYLFNAAFRDHVTYHFNENDLICGGYTIWGEFIAELMYYEVADDDPLPLYNPVLMELKHLLFQSFSGEVFFPYMFGHYAAKVIDDPTVESMMQHNPNRVDIGLGMLRDEIADRVIEALSILDKQFCKDEYWIASEDFMKELGVAFNAIWDETARGEVFNLG